MNHSLYPSYSVAIRTLGTAGDKYYRELVSIDNQSIRPDKIYIYIITNIYSVILLNTESTQLYEFFR